MKLLLISFSILLIGCRESQLLNDDELTLTKEGFVGKQLRLDGFYFDKWTGGVYGTIFFFRNGICLDVGGVGENVQELERQIEEVILISDEYKKTKYNWGVFNIRGDSIKFELWYPSSGGPLKAYVREGVIVNDTTFLITESYRNQNDEKTEARPKSELYHFRAFAPKPDSTNDYVN
jgi:hypothetical protein